MNDEETIEIPISEYQAIKATAQGIAVSNQLIAEQNVQTQEEIRVLASAVKAMSDAMLQLMDNLKIEVNVPPAKLPDAAAKSYSMQIARDRAGRVSEITINPADA